MQMLDRTGLNVLPNQKLGLESPLKSGMQSRCQCLRIVYFQCGRYNLRKFTLARVDEAPTAAAR